MNHFEKVFKCFPINIQNHINNLDSFTRNSVEEIRLYKNEHVHIFTGNRKIILPGIIEGKEIYNILNNLVKFSYYAYEEDMAKGFITIDGGHRVGICGKAVIEKGKVKLIRDISSLNIRYSKEIKGCSDTLTHLLINKDNSLNNILIVSPPGCGKTTLLRDIARNIGMKEHKVAICDERSEIAGMYNGVSSYSFGNMTDILDGCPKADGMLMLVRSMSPEVIITDELGKSEDIDAIETCIKSGVSVITSVHGKNLDDLKKSSLHKMLDLKFFDIIIFLTGTPRAGTVREVLHG